MRESLFDKMEKLLDGTFTPNRFKMSQATYQSLRSEIAILYPIYQDNHPDLFNAPRRPEFRGVDIQFDESLNYDEIVLVENQMEK